MNALHHNRQSALGNGTAIADAYIRERDRLENYIARQIGDRAEAENITQDVFVRLLGYDRELIEETLTSLIYNIARNLVIDHMRRQARTLAVAAEHPVDFETASVCSPEYEISARQISAFENKRVEQLPKVRRRVYMMSRFEGLAVPEIADTLNLSARTVENHLRLGRREVREYMLAVVS